MPYRSSKRCSFPFFQVGILLLALTSTCGAEWKVGVSSVVVTPDVPIHLVGYGGRKAPFSAVDTDIYAKALAFEDAEGTRGVIVTSDLVGLPDVFFGSVCERVTRETGLSRAQIMLNASHNHTGPLMSLNPDLNGNLAYSAFNDSEALRVVDYTKQLQQKIYQVAIDALKDLQPAELSWGTDKVTFVMNRRIIDSTGRVRMSPNPKGPVDDVVPVLKVAGQNGELRAVLFGCACHNTGLTANHNVISGDYAGYAQEILEERYPGTTALFMSGCGADANPEPRSDIPGVRKLGRELANAVSRVLNGSPVPVRGPLKCLLRQTDLPFKELDRTQLESYQGNVGLMTRHMLDVLDAGGRLRKHYTVPVAVWAFGDDLTMVALPSESVTEYALNIRRAHAGKPLWVSAYNNDFFGYVPSAQIVREGGHETIGVTTWLWGKDLADRAGLFTESVEEILMNTVSEMIEEIR